jgi:thiopurine S-methyltransferase
MNYNKKYWEEQYQHNQTGWDIGYVSTPIKEYIDQLTDKQLKILIPGAGNAYEVAYLHEQGFQNVFLLDFAAKPIADFKKKHPDFPKNHIIQEDFFTHKEQYDLILEQTFFSSLQVSKRDEYVEKTYNLLSDTGKLVGLLFDYDFRRDAPPFGGDMNIYKDLFRSKYNIIVLEKAYNSIKPRANNELFVIFEKK